MMRYGKLSVLMLAACLAVAFLTGCGGTVEAQQSSDEPLKLGINAWPGYGVVVIAEKQGFFEASNAKVEVQFFDSVDATNRSFAEKQLDAATMVLSDSISQSVAGVPLDVIWSTDTSTGGDMLLANPDILAAGDLRDKRIGIGYGTFGHVFVARLLAGYGISMDAVQLVNVGPEGVPAALAANEIDAGHTYPPFSDDAIQAGARILLSSADFPGAIVDVIAIQDGFVEERGEEVQRFVNALDQASAWWAQNPEAGNALVAEFLSVAPEDMPGIMEGLKVYSLADNKQSVDARLEGSIYESAQFGIDLFISLGIFEEVPDLETIINSTFVNNAGQ